MIRLVFSLAAVLYISASPIQAQDDSTRYIFGLPVSEDDTAEQWLQRDFEPKNKLTPLQPNALPGKVLKALNKEEQYEGWQDSLVYFDANTQLFYVPIRTENGVKIYGLNEEGNPVSFDEISSDPEDEP